MTMSMAAPTVSVIVPAYNAEATLPACLAAIARMSYQAAEVIVFSDGSTDRTADIAETSGVRVIRHTGASLGPGHGRNRAARAASSDLLLFVDSDVIISVTCLELMIAELQRCDAAAAFASYDNAPASTRVAGLYANLRHHFVHQNSAREATTFWSGVGLIEREVFVGVGGYDEGKYAHPSIEDVELGMRLKTAGHRIRLVPEALAKHCKDWTLWRVWHTDIVRRALPWSRLLVEGKSAGADLNLSSVERIKALASLGTFVALLVALFAPWTLLAAVLLFGVYLYLNRGFVRVLFDSLAPRQALAATLLHLCYHTYSLGAYVWVTVESAATTAFGPRRSTTPLPVQFDNLFIACLAILTVLFSWALLFHGTPAYFDDSASYLSGGEKIFERLFGLARAGGAEMPGGGSNGSGPTAIRSLPYYVLAYVLRAPGHSMFLLGLFQAMIAAFYVVLHCRIERLGPWPIVAIGTVLAVATPVALVSAFIVPDIFVVPVIGGITLLATRYSRMTPAMRIVLTLLAALGISTHVSIPPLALAMTGVALLWLVWTNRGAFHDALPGAVLATLPLTIGVAITMIGGLAGFGEASVAPKRLPLVLARSMSDGPGRWYLKQACPTHHYAICEIWPDGKFPDKLGPILFQEGSIMQVANEDQLERIRKEEPEIVLAAIRAFPMFQVRKTLSSIGKQFVTYTPTEINFDRRFYTAPDGSLRATATEWVPSPPVAIVDALTHLLVPLSAVLLLLSLPLIPRSRRPVVLLCLIGIVANMAICAAFSAVAARYAMRVLWLVPLLAALYALGPLQAAAANLGKQQRANGKAVAAKYN